MDTSRGKRLSCRTLLHSLPAKPLLCASLLVMPAASGADVAADNLSATLTTSLGTSSSVGNVTIRPGGLLVAKGTLFTSPALFLGEQGAGTRMLWHPRKAAFRAGKVDGTEWDEANIGRFSLATGYLSIASGEGSVALGNSTATADYATALGGSLAYGVNSAAIGCAIANANFSIALGEVATADGEDSVAIGPFAHAQESYSMSFGYQSATLGQSSTAIGVEAVTTGYGATALGLATKADALFSCAVGTCNVGGGDPWNWDPEDPIFEVGNGFPEESPKIRSNAMTVYKNGNVDMNGDVQVQGVITCAPGGDIPMFTAD